MFQIPQKSYRQIAMECLAGQGITAVALAKEASPDLKRFRLDVDMGLLDVEVPEGAPGEDPLLPYATSLLTHLVAWPPKVANYGVSIAGLIEDAICWMVGFNEAEVEKPDWGAHVAKIQDEREKNQILNSRFSAVRYMEHLLSELPVEHYSYRVCETALMTVADSLQFMPREVRTPEVCLRAVSILSSNALHIPHAVMSEDLLMQVFEISPFSITAIPERFYTRELVEKASAGHPDVVVFIPDHYLTPRLLEAKFKAKEEAIQRGRERRLRKS